MGKTAIVLGASGLTGNCLLEILLKDERYETVKLFSRSSISIKHPKIKEYIGDLLELMSFKEQFYGDEVFCCIGTTQKKTPDKEQYRQIDFGIPVTAAKLAKENGIDTFLVISSMGANPKGGTFYIRTKGEMELAVLSESIENTYILRPSIIGGKRNEKRAFEKIGITVFKSLEFLLFGKLRKYRLIEASTIAQAMYNLANNKRKINPILESDHIAKLGNSK